MNDSVSQSQAGPGNPIQASFSVLIMSLASSAAVAMGLTPHPESGKQESDRNVAQFNIDLLLVLKDKTRGNLQADEAKFLDAIIADLQMQFLSIKK